jgi:hypothetical protein
MSPLPPIAQLNDALRTTFTGGHVMLTEGIQALPDEAKATVIAEVQGFQSFTEDNDPHGEHDFGAFDLAGAGKVFWKIDYYDLTLTMGSRDPADPSRTTRVLTIMLASEY